MYISGTLTGNAGTGAGTGTLTGNTGTGAGTGTGTSNGTGTLTGTLAYCEYMNPTGAGLTGSVILTNAVPPVKPMMAYSSPLSGSVHPHTSLPLALQIR